MESPNRTFASLSTLPKTLERSISPFDFSHLGELYFEAKRAATRIRLQRPPERTILARTGGPAINPLCDKDGASMYLKQRLAEESAAAFSTAYVCTSEYCDRRYSEGAGYFDSFDGETNLDPRQTLCEVDAMPMFLEFVDSFHVEVWRCPGCNGVTVR